LHAFCHWRGTARITGYFDLALLDDRTLAYRTYYGGANEFDDSPLHFIALFRGTSREPVQEACSVAAARIVATFESELV
jgi:hypothetical protein